MSVIRIPRLLEASIAADEQCCPARRRWLASLPEVVGAVASDWELALGEPYDPGGRCAWVAPVRDASGEELVLKLGWRHPEAEHEADALRVWDGDGAVRCVAARVLEETIALLLERCRPGVQLKRSVPERDQDLVMARLMRRLWDHELPLGHPFQTLRSMCHQRAESFELRSAADSSGLDPGLARAAIEILRGLPESADRAVLLCTDLHAENILAARREPWLAIDPKPLIGDPAYDPVQHMLNCDQRLANDPVGLSARMASLLELDAERVRLWLFARCAQESLGDPALREPARRLAP